MTFHDLFWPHLTSVDRDLTSNDLIFNVFKSKYAKYLGLNADGELEEGEEEDDGSSSEDEESFDDEEGEEE